MFLKPFIIKSKSIIKNTECKKLRNKLVNQYDNINDSILNIIIPPKCEIVLAKLLLNNGNVSNVYLIQSQPILFTLDDILFFTVYSLWKCQHSIPFLITWPHVLEKLLNGADLMLPGVILNESSKIFNVNQPCVVCLKGNCSAVSIGLLLISSADIYEKKVEKGKIVLILHCYKDLLWSLGNKSNPPQTDFIFNDIIESSDSSTIQLNNKLTDESMNEPLDALNYILLDESKDSQGNIDELSNSQHNQLDDISCLNIDDHSSYTELIKCIDNGDDNQLNDDNILKFDSMDDLIDKILCYTLKKQKNTLTLPILTSTFYRNFLITNCPQGNTVDIKQTSFKKLSNYLSAKKKKVPTATLR